MDPVTLGAVLLAVITGASESLSGKLWDGVVTLVRRPFRHGASTPSGEAALAALEQAPADKQRAQALAEDLINRAGADADFKQALDSWWEQAKPVRESVGDVANTISGGVQHGPVFQGRDFSNLNLNFGTTSTPPAPRPDS
jgi:hypothetical protein